MRRQLQQLALRYPSLRPWAERWQQEPYYSGAKNFLLAIGLLTVALLLALAGAAAFDRRDLREAAAYHFLALAITFYVGVKLVPQMARRTALGWLFIQVDYKLTRGGVVYLAATFVIVAAAMNTGNNLLFMVLASLLAGLLMSGVLSRIVLTNVSLELELPEHVFARQPVSAELTLVNGKRLLPSLSLTVSGREPRVGKRPKKGAREETRQVLREAVYFPYLPRGRWVRQTVELSFPRRGRYAQDAFRVSSKFPFGLLEKGRRVEAASEVVVYPAVEPTEEFYEILPLISGEMESYARGHGHGLYAIRDYQPGDSARTLDWKATAKAQRLQVREFTREDERRVELVFDPYLPSGDARAQWEERFEKAVTFCACLAWHFYEIHAQMKFRAPAFETGMAGAGEVIYDVLHHLALVEPRWDGAQRFLETLGATDTFKIILTARARGSIPTALWTSSYFVFLASLR
ncbi:MAG: DUF58 domain-containing protein [Terriglobia bacterium]